MYFWFDRLLFGVQMPQFMHFLLQLFLDEQWPAGLSIIMEDNQSDSYDETKLDSLRQQLATPKAQLLRLAYNTPQLALKIDALNQQGCRCIQQQLFYESMVFLQEAERILEYAAGCGTTIDRSLIVVTLHNQATVYQRIWELVRSADYIEAIIYNVTTFLEAQGKAEQVSKEQQRTRKSSIEESRLSVYLGTKLSLITYLLQFCAVSSQIKNHLTALQSAQKALFLLKSYCQQLYAHQKAVGCKGTSDFEKTLLLQLHNIRDFCHQQSQQLNSYINKLTSKAYKSIVGFQKRIEWAPVGLSKPEVKELEMFSLGQLMQVSPQNLTKVQQRLQLQLELTLVRKIYKAIYISITHFTIATELRLLASQKYGTSTESSQQRRQSKEFKQSQVHHLVAVITVALYVPCYTKFFEHILKSYQNHYNIDLTVVPQNGQSSEDKGDIIHLQIQSVSEGQSIQEQKGQSTGEREATGADFITERFKRGGKDLEKQKVHNKTAQELGGDFNSHSSSQNSKLKHLSRSNTEALSIKPAKKHQKVTKKIVNKKKPKSRKDQENTSREKRIIIVEKVKAKSHSKHKRDSHRSQSGMKQAEEEEKVVHYFQYDNYRKVVRKTKTGKQEPSDLLRRANKLREKKSPQALLNAHMKQLKHMQSSKQLTPLEVKTVKTMRSAQRLRPPTSRKHK